ncbi:MAG: hypothetical protein KDA84_08970 [Planctomycetaceae bacterium]|nr:hypothetical protein [Planctomycetaceae bacterium]
MTDSVYKKSLSAASLVVAIPGAFLGYLLVMAFLQTPGFDNMAGFFKIISGLSLSLATLMVLMPLVILIFGPKAEPIDEASDTETADGKTADALEEDDEDEEEISAVIDEDDQMDDAFEEEDADAFDDDDFGDDGFDDFDDDDEFV